MTHYLDREWLGTTAFTPVDPIERLERKDEGDGGEGNEPDPVKAIEELSTALTGKMDGFTTELCAGPA